MAVAVAGVTLGVVIVLLWAVMFRPDSRPSAATSTTPTPTVSAPVATATPEQLSNPDLAPRNLHAEFAGDYIRLSWEEPVDTPRRFLIGIAPDRAADTVLVDQALFDARSAEVPVEGSWRRACVVVIGERDSHTGFEQRCISR